MLIIYVQFLWFAEKDRNGAGFRSSIFLIRQIGQRMIDLKTERNPTLVGFPGMCKHLDVKAVFIISETSANVR